MRALGLLISIPLALAAFACPSSPVPDGGCAGCDAGQPGDGGGQPDGGEPDGGPPDAGEPDAGVPPLVRLDWVTTRGPALQPAVVAEHQGRAFALSNTTYAVESDCDGGACTYTWYTDAGAVLRRRVLSPVATAPWSPDGKQFVAAESDGGRMCIGPGASLPVIEATWGLYDGQGGERLVSEGPLVLDPGLVFDAFSSHGTLTWRERIDPATCEPVEIRAVRTSPPYGVPPALGGIASDPGFPAYAEDDTPEGLLLVSTRQGLNTGLGLARPDDTATYTVVEPDAQLWRQTGGFLHVVQGYPFRKVTQVRTRDRGTRQQALDWSRLDLTSAAASGRWFMACSVTLPGYRECQLVDALGQRPIRFLQTAVRPSALAGGAERVVYPVADGGFAQLDLVTGMQGVLAVPATRVQLAGLGGGFVLTGDERAWGLTSGEPFGLGERLRAVHLGTAQVEQPQSQVVFIVSSNATGSLTHLDIWNVAHGRVARVTDNLVYNPPFNQPFTADDRCDAPGFVRHLGPPAASARQPGALLHFTEFVPAAQPKLRVFVLPADLSEPPRLFAELDPDTCSPPLASPGLERLWLPVVTPSGAVRAVLASWR